jgi:hypothetical protein
MLHVLVDYEVVNKLHTCLNLKISAHMENMLDFSSWGNQCTLDSQDGDVFMLHFDWLLAFGSALIAKRNGKFEAGLIKCEKNSCSRRFNI